MRIAIPLVIDMTDEQVRQYADERGLPLHDGKPYARDVVENVRSYVLTSVQDSPVFGEAGNGDRGATVSIKR